MIRLGRAVRRRFQGGATGGSTDRKASERAPEDAMPLNRKEFFRLAEGYTPYVVADCGSLLLVPTSDRRRDKLFWKGIKEHEVLARALGELRRLGVEMPGETFVDAGANIGTTTLTALKAGFSSVIAFEPEPSAFRLLRANLVLNDAESVVRALPLALSDRSGNGQLAVIPQKTGAAYLLSDSRARLAPTRGVTLVRLDDLVDDGTVEADQIGLIWIDVEGHEGHVLRGARRTLEQGMPVVFELNPHALRRSRALDGISGLVSDCFDHFFDLRSQDADAQASDDFEAILFRTQTRGDVTDVLAFNRA